MSNHAAILRNGQTLHSAHAAAFSGKLKGLLNSGIVAIRSEALVPFMQAGLACHKNGEKLGIN